MSSIAQRQVQQLLRVCEAKWAISFDVDKRVFSHNFGSDLHPNESVSVEVDFISPYAIRIKSPVYGTGMGMPSRILAELQSLLAKQINKVKEDPVVQPFLLANHILTFLHKKYPLNDSFVDADYTAYVSATDKLSNNKKSTKTQDYWDEVALITQESSAPKTTKAIPVPSAPRTAPQPAPSVPMREDDDSPMRDTSPFYPTYRSRQKSAKARAKEAAREAAQQAAAEEEDQERLMTENCVKELAKKIKLSQAQHNDPFVQYIARVLHFSSPMMLFARNSLKTVPDVARNFQFITEINLSENELVVLPSYFAFSQLRALYLHKNKLRWLPPLHGCPKLQILDVTLNQLRELPDLSSLSELSNVIAERNKLKLFPESVLHCPKLCRLDVRVNKITAVPRTISRFVGESDSFVLAFMLNPIANIPNTIYRHSVSKAVDYFTVLAARMKEHESVMLSSDLFDALRTPPSPMFSDVSIIAKDGTIFDAHSLILATRSKVFRAAIKEARAGIGAGVPLEAADGSFSYSMDATTSKIQIITDKYSALQVQILLDYFYGDLFTPLHVELIRITDAMTSMTEIEEAREINAQSYKANESRYTEAEAVASDFNLLHLQAVIEYAKTNILPPTERIKPSSFNADFAGLYSVCMPQQLHVNSVIVEDFPPDVFFHCPLDPTHPPIAAHRLILAARSGFFKNLFTAGLLESRTNHIPLPDVHPNVLSSVIEYCYTNETKSLDPETIIDLLRASHEWGLMGLQEKLESVVGEALDMDNVLSLTFASVAYGMKRLYKHCKGYVMSNWTELIETSEWNDLSTTLRDKLIATATKWAIPGFWRATHPVVK